MRHRKGSTLFVLLTIITILFITGLAFLFVTSEEHNRSGINSHNIEAFYLAESGISEGTSYLRELLTQPLISPDGEVNRDVLAVLDINRAEHFRKEFSLDKLPANAKVDVSISFKDIHKTPFVGYIDEYANVPESLKTYKREGRDKKGLRGLGGWSGDLLIESIGHYKKSKKKIVIRKKIKVNDLTPVADNYTFFVGSKREEYLKNGEFRLSNFSLSRNLKGMVDVLIGSITDSVIKGMGQAAISLFWDPSTKTYVSFKGDFKTRALSIIRDLVMGSSDIKIKDYVDEVIAELNPYRWGRIRTNGKLHIYLPFFLADDIINYFDDNSIFSHQRPEIGYLYCYNLLHDPYLSRYTYYEGKIIKYFQKLKPYILGTTNRPYPSFEPYTITTRFDFVNRHRERIEPPNLDRIKKSARQYADEVYEKNLVLHGSYRKPLIINGIHYVQGNLSLGGFITGKVMFVVDGTITITSDIRHAGKNDLITIVALKKKIRLKKDNTRIEAAIYSRNSITGGKLVSIYGNLAVHNLNRQKGRDGTLLMPKRVRVSYDPDLKSGAVGNISLGISRLITSYKDIKAR